MKDIKRKIAIINNVNEMNFNEDEKEVLLNNIFNYRYLLTKNHKTKEELEREEEYKEKIKDMIEKFIHELQVSELVNNKSVFSRKKNMIRKKLNFFKTLNILEERQLREYEENMMNNERNKTRKKEKTIKISDDKDKKNKKRRTRFNKFIFKKDTKLIYDNSNMYKKTKKKKKQIKDVINDIINKDFTLNDSNNNSNSNSISNINSNNNSTCNIVVFNKSFYSCINKSNKTKFKSKIGSRRKSV